LRVFSAITSGLNWTRLYRSLHGTPKYLPLYGTGLHGLFCPETAGSTWWDEGWQLYANYTSIDTRGEPKVG